MFLTTLYVVAPVWPESFFGVSVRHVQDLSDARDDVGFAADELIHFTYLVAFR